MQRIILQCMVLVRNVIVFLFSAGSESQNYSDMQLDHLLNVLGHRSIVCNIIIMYLVQ